MTQVGKEVLLNAVTQAIPTYTMNVFKLPINFCKEIASMMARFWWNHQHKDKGIHWKKCKQLGTAKEARWLGFRDMEAFNNALLCKQMCRILRNPEYSCCTSAQAEIFHKYPLATSQNWSSILSCVEKPMQLYGLVKKRVILESR